MQPVRPVIVPYLDYTNAFVEGMDHNRERRLQRMHARQLVLVDRSATVRRASTPAMHVYVADRLFCSSPMCMFQAQALHGIGNRL